ncbi:MAG: response regulator [Rhodospirillales bacterium]
MGHILLIDDDDEFREQLAEFIVAAGHRVTVCADGEEGLAQFRKHAPDAVVTDIVMERTEGIETLQAIRHADAAIPVIVMSGNDTYLRLARGLGADHGLHKPFSARHLISLLEERLEHGRVGF